MNALNVVFVDILYKYICFFKKQNNDKNFPQNSTKESREKKLLPSVEARSELTEDL